MACGCWSGRVVLWFWCCFDGCPVWFFWAAGWLVVVVVVVGWGGRGAS